MNSFTHGSNSANRTLPMAWRLERSWPENPNARATANGVQVPRPQRVKEWEHSYYLLYPAMRTNAEFIEQMKALAAHGCFD